MQWSEDFCFTTTTSSLKQMDRLKIGVASSKLGDDQNNILNHLQAKGWDIENRLYLGFGPRRLEFSVLAENVDPTNPVHESTPVHEKTL